jgi:succinate dehydrogenase / fumarate reductase, cytochrome b subunit
MAAKAPAPRPLSPHLQIYRWTWTMAMSVFHRITGAALYGGTVLLALWLLALATGGRFFEVVNGLFQSWFGLLVLFGFTWALMHHMLGGIRHFIWDTGAAFEMSQRMALARLTLIGSVVLTALLWGGVFFLRGV